MTVEFEHGTEQYAYVTTTGRVSGLPREIEIWFCARGNRIYLLSGGGHASHWVMNLLQKPRVTVRIDDAAFSGVASVLEPGEEAETIRPLMAAKYEDWREGKLLSNWARTALPVRIDLEPSA